jgi:hypothetical protein
MDNVPLVDLSTLTVSKMMKIEGVHLQKLFANEFCMNDIYYFKGVIVVRLIMICVCVRVRVCVFKYCSEANI